LDRARRSAGQEWTATCPSCGKSSKFYVNTETGRWICFSEDGFRGKAIWSLIAHVEGITPAQARAEVLRANVKFTRRRKSGLSALAERVADLRGREVEERMEIQYGLPDEFVPVYKESRRKPWMMPRYLSKDRKIKKSTAADWGLGFCRGGTYDGRIIIPIVCPNGYSFTARGTQKWHVPKYLNPPGADHSKLLIGWEYVDQRSDVVLVEGPTDALMNYQNGIPSYALGGKELSDVQMGLMFKKPPDCAVTVMLDPEAVGEIHKVARKLALHFNEVYLAWLPPGVDPGSATRKQAWKAVDNAERHTGKRTAGMLERLKML
jgi:hypothetical protein